ncbi:MAG: hypothetical protein GY895_04955 [Phycisphaera sp.]|nr:hypothetical protein [Phycisphaera sp.]
MINLPRIGTFSALAITIMLTGCSAPAPSNASLAGSWEGRASETERPFSFGSVTFAPSDSTSGTYTAEAKYGDKTRVQTGHFVVTRDGLILDDERTYELGYEGDTVIFTDPVSGNSMTLDRFN